MNDKIKLPYLIIVEGKYDKIKLDSIFDAVIIQTDGFGIFKNKSKLEFVKKYSKDNGIIIVTDSDNAGFIIRNFLKNKCTGGNIYNVYIPDVFGKEKRKDKASSEGKLGVEGIKKKIIIDCFISTGLIMRDDAGNVVSTYVSAEQNIDGNKRIITKADMFMLGFCGGDNSRALLLELLRALSFPEDMNINTALEVINRNTDTDYIVKIMQKISGKKII